MVLTLVSLYDGSQLVAVGAPDQLWNTRVDGQLHVELLGGGSARLPKDDIAAMHLHRRGWRGDRVVGASS